VAWLVVDLVLVALALLVLGVVAWRVYEAASALGRSIAHTGSRVSSLTAELDATLAPLRERGMRAARGGTDVR
jgi:Sec-independent protein translocase protein TatA